MSDLADMTIEEIKRVRVKDGDIVSVGFRGRVTAAMAMQFMKEISKKMHDTLGLKKVLLVPLFNGATVATLSEAYMNKNGWFRKEKGGQSNAV